MKYSNTHGSGVYKGSELCRTYCVQWKTRNAKPARKSRGDRYPATGLMVNPVRSVKSILKKVSNYVLTRGKSMFSLRKLPLRKRETSSSWGMLSSRHSQYLDRSGRFFKYSRQAWVGYNLLSSLYTTPHVFTSSSVNSMRGMGSPLDQDRKKCLGFKSEMFHFQSNPHNKQVKHTVCRPLQGQQSTFSFSGRHCP